jgi:hypothetical protein
MLPPRRFTTSYGAVGGEEVTGEIVIARGDVNRPAANDLASKSEEIAYA